MHDGGLYKHCGYSHINKHMVGCYISVPTWLCLWLDSTFYGLLCFFQLHNCGRLSVWPGFTELLYMTTDCVWEIVIVCTDVCTRSGRAV